MWILVSRTQQLYSSLTGSLALIRTDGNIELRFKIVRWVSSIVCVSQKSKAHSIHWSVSKRQYIYDPRMHPILLFHHHFRAIATVPSATVNRASAPGSVPRIRAAPLLPELVAPRTFSMPEWPYDVASTAGSM